MTETSLQPGYMLGKYRIEALLGEGGAARVYRARHASLGTLHAVKVLSKVTSRMRDRLLLEGRVQASLSHPNIVRVVDVDEIAGFPCLVMEYIDGPTLGDVIQDRPLPLSMVRELGAQILSGMAHAHDRGLVHRDIKPGNVLLARDGDGIVAKVADFGLVKVENNPHSATRTGTTMGTPLYMSPEQIRCAKHVDARTDVFSLGTLFYTLLAGENPFRSEDLYEVFNRIVEQQQAPIAQVAPEGTPQRILDAVDKAMQVDTEKRFRDAGEMLEAWTGETRTRTAADPELLSLVSSHSTSIESSLENTPTSYPDEVPTPPKPEVRQPETLNLEDQVDSARPQAPEPPGGSRSSPLPWVVAGVAALVAIVLLVVAMWPAAEVPSTPMPAEPTEVAGPSPEPEPPAPEPASEPVLAPAVPEPSPTKPVVPAPRPAPTRPAPAPSPVAPSPSPEPRVAEPEPEPSTTTEVAPAPEPETAPSPAEPAPAPTHGTVENANPSVRVFLRSAAGDFRPGRIEPGTYTIVAMFGGTPTPAGTVQIEAGQVRRIDCKPGLQLCQVR